MHVLSSELQVSPCSKSADALACGIPVGERMRVPARLSPFPWHTVPASDVLGEMYVQSVCFIAASSIAAPIRTQTPRHTPAYVFTMSWRSIAQSAHAAYSLCCPRAMRMRHASRAMCYAHGTYQVLNDVLNDVPPAGPTPQPYQTVASSPPSAPK